jgi:hypothetical protein
MFPSARLSLLLWPGAEERLMDPVASEELQEATPHLMSGMRAQPRRHGESTK